MKAIVGNGTGAEGDRLGMLARSMAGGRLYLVSPSGPDGMVIEAVGSYHEGDMPRKRRHWHRCDAWTRDASLQHRHSRCTLNGRASEGHR
tara:strand:+ start:23291 stop:23560 length:270 start_codon:yes stop_codon:yes gene_type:complete